VVLVCLRFIIRQQAIFFVRSNLTWMYALKEIELRSAKLNIT
jgi:hypothetical protein